MIDDVLGGADWRTDLFDVDAYLEAVRIERAEPTLDLLESIHRTHTATFPFANIDVLLGTHPGVAPDRVQEQLVARRRGGYCFEHAQIVAAVLEDLGYRVRRTLGRVHEIHHPRTHMTVIAEVEGRRWLCDPGFGFSITGPIELREGATRRDGGRRHEITRTADGDHLLWTLLRDGEVQHHVDDMPAHPPEVRAAHFVTSRFEHSGFVRRLVVARHRPEGHVTLTATHRTVRADGAETELVELGLDEVLEAIVDLGVCLHDDEIEPLRERLRTIRDDEVS